MSTCRLPGLLGLWIHPPIIDAGTTTRARTAAPRQLGTAARGVVSIPPSLTLSRVLHEGARGPDVAWLQRRLNQSAGSSTPLLTDGEFGPATARRLRQFQAAAGIAADGVVGRATWLALQGRTQRLSGVEHVASPPAAAPAATGSAAQPGSWMDIARAEIGQAEVGGRQHNPRILDYHAATTLNARSDEVAWCSSFVNWVLRQAGYQGTRSAAAASWLNWGQASEAREGAIVVIRNAQAANSSLTTTGNHVGFLVEETTSHYVILGGNQSDQVKESRFRRASWTLRGYRWPA
jgi:uncharacterized protein (TIGR02594 family)